MAPPPARPLLGLPAFYALTAAFIALAGMAHEYSHFAAHEGPRLPDVRLFGGAVEAEASIMHVSEVRLDGQRVLVRQPAHSLIALYPGLALHALTLGLLPQDLYPDDGVLASTFFHLSGPELAGAAGRGWAMSAGVQAAPILVAVPVFALALAWVLARPSLLNRALLFAYSVELACNGHHAAALGIDPALYSAFGMLAMALAMFLAIARGPTGRQLLERLSRMTYGPDPSPSGAAPAAAATASFPARHAGAAAILARGRRGVRPPRPVVMLDDRLALRPPPPAGLAAASAFSPRLSAGRRTRAEVRVATKPVRPRPAK